MPHPPQRWNAWNASSLRSLFDRILGVVRYSYLELDHPGEVVRVGDVALEDSVRGGVGRGGGHRRRPATRREREKERLGLDR